MNSSPNSPETCPLFLLVFLYSCTVFLARFLEAEITVWSSRRVTGVRYQFSDDLLLSDGNCSACYFYSYVMNGSGTQQI